MLPHSIRSSPSRIALSVSELIQRRSNGVAQPTYSYVSEDQLAFASRIRRYDDALALAEQPRDNLDLRRYVAVRLIALVGLDLTRDELEDGRDDRQVITVETLEAVAVRQGGLHQMAESPCYIVLRSGIIADFALVRFHDAGDFPRHARFFCDDNFHTEWIYLMWI